MKMLILALICVSGIALAQDKPKEFKPVPLTKEELAQFETFKDKAKLIENSTNEAFKLLDEKDDDASILKAGRLLQVSVLKRKSLDVDVANFIGKGRKDHDCNDCVLDQDAKNWVKPPKQEEPKEKK